jgi:hypothetical protein
VRFFTQDFQQEQAFLKKACRLLVFIVFNQGLYLPHIEKKAYEREQRKVAIMNCQLKVQGGGRGIGVATIQTTTKKCVLL